MSDFAQGNVSVSSSLTLVCLVQAENDGVLVQNTGSTTVYLGGRSLTASGATQGFPLTAGTTALLPSWGPNSRGLYGITATGTTTVNYFFPKAVDD